MKGLDLDELVLDVKRADLNGVKELKVKLPVRLLVNLHFIKLTESRAISDIVNEALTNYFVSMAATRSAGAAFPASSFGAAKPNPGEDHPPPAPQVPVS